MENTPINKHSPCMVIFIHTSCDSLVTYLRRRWGAFIENQAENRQEERSCFSRPSLCTGHKISAVQYDWQRILLYWSGCGVLSKLSESKERMFNIINPCHLNKHTANRPTTKCNKHKLELAVVIPTNSSDYTEALCSVHTPIGVGYPYTKQDLIQLDHVCI